MNRYSALAQDYRTALFEDVLPFWDRHSPDRKCGGYFTCLDRSGEVYDQDKFVWLQGRQAWLYASLYNRVEQRPEWLDMSRLGVEFLRTFGANPQGQHYFSLTREGRPLIQPCNIFSDCFATMAFSQYALASGDHDARDRALHVFEGVLERQDHPKGPFTKAFPGTRPLRSFALPMILLNLTLELEWILGERRTHELLSTLLDEVTHFFLDPARMVFFEHVAPDGTHPDTFEGRLLNPGHGIESCWFIMEAARKIGRPALVTRAIEVVLATLDLAWDRECEGIFYFLDAQGKPPLQLEWDQKLWWVHCEALVALALGLQLTGNPLCADWFDRVHDYTWAHFPDPKYGEWFGYLNRRGEVLLPLKGGKWKGCFHIPRALYRCWNILQSLD
jgi:N-acylglucosamine 2-epimerase